MERQSWPRILLILLVCASAALPAAAKPNCGGYVRYFNSTGFYAPHDSAATNYANDVCRSMWPSSSTYSAAGAFSTLFILSPGPHLYRHECWKCSTYPAPWPYTIPFDQAVAIARQVKPGEVISAGLGEIPRADGSLEYVYHVDILQGDLIVRVDVDTETGAAMAPEPTDPIGEPIADQ